jgi:hypothetical protein
VRELHGIRFWLSVFSFRFFVVGCRKVN